jgi:hypothetical protein
MPKGKLQMSKLNQGHFLFSLPLVALLQSCVSIPQTGDKRLQICGYAPTESCHVKIDIHGGFSAREYPVKRGGFSLSVQSPSHEGSAAIAGYLVCNGEAVATVESTISQAIGFGICLDLISGAQVERFEPVR